MRRGNLTVSAWCITSVARLLRFACNDQEFAYSGNTFKRVFLLFHCSAANKPLRFWPWSNEDLPKQFFLRRSAPLRQKPLCT